MVEESNSDGLLWRLLVHSVPDKGTKESAQFSNPGRVTHFCAHPGHAEGGVSGLFSKRCGARHCKGCEGRVSGIPMEGLMTLGTFRYCRIIFSVRDNSKSTYQLQCLSSEG